MAIEKKDISQVPSAQRTAFQKASDAGRKQNFDYAISLLKNTVIANPGFMEARAKLREFERAMPAPGFMTQMLNKLKAGKNVAGGQMKMGKDPRAAMAAAEEALAFGLNNAGALKLLAAAAAKEEAHFIAVEALEIANEFSPNDLGLMDMLAKAYRANHQANDALRVRQQMANMQPGSLEAQAAVREAAAAATMETNWDDRGGSFADKLKDKGESAATEQADRIVRNADDVRDMIGRMEARFAKEPKNIELARKLGELHQKDAQHDKAIEYFNKASELIGSVDPTIDRLIEKSELAKFDQSIQQWNEYGEANPDSKAEAEQNVAAFEQQKYQLRLDKANSRVSNYPSDLQLRYELALVQWEGQDVDNAIEQFQLAQKNPQRRLSTLVYLGRCFYAKGQHDIAIEQFDRAIADMLTMDKQKLEALYYLGMTHEAMGNMDKAMECYKEIYQADSKFQDVGAKVQGFYAAKQKH